MYSAQRTNFKTTIPRLATKPGQSRRLEVRSKNRGKKSPVMSMLLALRGNR